MSALKALQVIEKAVIIGAVLYCFLPALFFSLLGFTIGFGRESSIRTSSPELEIVLLLSAIATIAMFVFTYQIVISGKSISAINNWLIFFVFIGVCSALFFAIRLAPVIFILLALVAYVLLYAYRNRKKNA